MGRTAISLPIKTASEPAFQADPGSGFHCGGINDLGIIGTQVASRSYEPIQILILFFCRWSHKNMLSGVGKKGF